MSLQAPLVIGVDFGGTSIKMGVVQGTEIIDHAPPIATQEFASAKDLIHAMERTINDLRQHHPKVAAVGIGLPGVVDFHKGIVADLTNVPGWYRVPIKSILSDAIQLPVVTDNDAHCMAYAEWKLGAARGCRDVICVTLGTGIGGGIIANGQIVRGASFGAGHIGQMSINLHGRTGAYGNKGALEDYIGNREMVLDARELYHQNNQHQRADLTPATLAEAAHAGDPIAQQVWENFAEKLASALMSCVYLLNPEIIVLGGGVARAGDILFTPLNKHLLAQIPPQFSDTLSVVAAQFGSESGILGAAVLAAEELDFHY